MKGASMNKFMKMAALAAVIGVFGAAQAQLVSVKFTTNALGLGTDDINEDSVVDADQAGKLITSATTGEGSKMWIQVNGVAGPGTMIHQLLMTVTARTHLDVTTGLPSSHDYHAGILYISKENNALPDCKDEGLGVRAFTVAKTTGLRTFDGSGRAKIEGSKEVSGGTDSSAFNPTDPNGAPHVDEDVKFKFSHRTLANSVKFCISKMEATDWIQVDMKTVGGGTYSKLVKLADASYLTLGNTAGQGVTNDKVYTLHMSGFAALGLGAADEVDEICIRAVDDNPSNPSGTAEHFLISGMQAMVVPEPGSMIALGAGVAIVALRRRKR